MIKTSDTSCNKQTCNSNERFSFLMAINRGVYDCVSDRMNNGAIQHIVGTGECRVSFKVPQYKNKNTPAFNNSFFEENIIQ